jgi:hypothetical protein
MQAMKNWYAERPELFVKRPYDHPGCDSYDATAQAYDFSSISPKQRLATVVGIYFPPRTFRGDYWRYQ